MNLLITLWTLIVIYIRHIHIRSQSTSTEGLHLYHLIKLSDILKTQSVADHCQQLLTQRERRLTYKTTQCVICWQVKYHESTSKHRICESGRAQYFLEVTAFFRDEVYKQTCDIQDIYGVFGVDIYYHPACFNKYIKHVKRFENSRRPVPSSTMSTRKQLLNSVFEGIHHGLVVRLPLVIHFRTKLTIGN